MFQNAVAVHALHPDKPGCRSTAAQVFRRNLVVKSTKS
jgi:hypothetical protein